MRRCASNTFQAAECAAMVRLFRRLDNPATRDLIKDLTSVRGKFLRMNEAIEKANACEQPQTSATTSST